MPRRASRQRGFALVVAVTLMVLLTLIAIGFLSLSSVTLRSSTTQEATSTARANARMALALAISQLQQFAGKDQIVTAESDVLVKSSSSGANSAAQGASGGKQLRWVGVWNSAAVNQTTSSSSVGQPETWLVSGGGRSSAPDPENVSQQGTVLVASDLSGASTSGVRVPLVEIRPTNQKTSPGRYAYWVSDLGVKAKVNIPIPPASNPVATQVAQSQLAGESQLGQIGDAWKNVGNDEKRKWFTMASGRLFAKGGSSQDLTRQYQHDLTCDGYGLPVDVSRGGFKKDLTTIFEDPALCSQYLGGKPNGTTMTVSAPTTFYLIDDYTGRKVGPNWGNLYHYYQQYRLTDTKFVPPDSGNTGIDIRSNDWEPYNNVSRKFGTDTYTDVQHLNSPMNPVVALLRMNFRLGAKEIADPADSKKKIYQLRLHVKPIVSLWNPYNFRLEMEQDLSFSWATFPYLKLEIKDSKGTREQKVWLREIAKNTGTVTTPPRNYSDLFIPKSIGAFEPGEAKIYSVSTTQVLGSTNTLDNKALNYRADFFADLVDGVTKQPVTAAEQSATVKISEMYLDDMQTPETRTRWTALDPKTNSGSYLAIKHNGANLARYTGFWAPEQTGKRLTPGDVDVKSLPPLQISTLTGNNVDPLVAWEIRTRTTDNDIDPARIHVEGNPRAVVWNAKWDGSTASSGWRFATPLQGGGPLRDGVSLSPAVDEFDPDMRLRGGNATEPSEGRSHVVLFDVPRAPLASLAQFQHANLSRYQFEPTYVVGNSYISPRMPSLNQVSTNNFAGFNNFTLVDSSYEINRKLWDSFAFSTWSGAFSSTAQTPPGPDGTLPIEKLVSGEISLPNPRHLVRKLGAEQSFNDVKDSATKGYEAEAIMARIAVDGAFNVNSTSVTAWKTVLASLTEGKVPLVGTTSNGAPSLVGVTGKDTARFSRFACVTDASGAGSAADGDAFWKSYRKLDANELTSLAQEIVAEIKSRGPFRSLAEFVNRNPQGKDAEQQRVGALQAALDRAINSKISAVSKLTAPSGMNGDAINTQTENQAAGAPGYLTQADVLQTLGPILQPRSDVFRIRAVGQALDRTGTKVIAEAVCEAVVQRTASYVDSSDAAELPPADASNPSQVNSKLKQANQRFGRKFQLDSFRWLHHSEI